MVVSESLAHAFIYSRFFIASLCFHRTNLYINKFDKFLLNIFNKIEVGTQKGDIDNNKINNILWYLVTITYVKEQWF